METVAAFDILSILGTALNIMWAVLGLGLVIFFHELGHFAVAKWCNVNVERFSIGFGPVIWGTTRGETEYALSLIPFGGYVKMLGQDDMDPSQLTSDEIALDPRSYSAKSVPQRMAIISAGVIMNIITGLMFFAIAFRIGIETPAAVVGTVQVGMPAWTVGVEEGDRIREINGEEVNSFTDILRGVALTTGMVHLKGEHADGTPYEVKMKPDTQGTRRMIGVGPSRGLQLIPTQEEKISPVLPGSPAADAKPGFANGDTMLELDGEKLESFAQLQDLLARKRAKEVTFHVQRENSQETADIKVGPNPFRTLGLHMDIGQIAAIKEGSPADKAGFKIDDKIATIQVVGKTTDDSGEEKEIPEKDVGKQINPVTLPDYLADLHGQELIVTVRRQVPGSEEKVIPIKVTPLDKPGWIEQPSSSNLPLSIPALGIATHIQRNVVFVDENSPAAKAGIEPGDRIAKMELSLPEGAEPVIFKDQVVTVDFDPDGAKTNNDNNWAYAFWMMQLTPNRTVKLTVSTKGKEREVELTPELSKEWFVPLRGIRPMALSTTLKTDSMMTALGMGVTHTKNTISQIYLTIRNLLGGFLSYKELHGPIGIASVAYQVASQGLADLLIFLGFLSINLAVLNFLPIPVLDGGHMVFLIWEAVTRRKPSERIMIIATYCGLFFVLGLMLLVIYLDLFVHKLG